MSAISISSSGRERGRACQPAVPKGVIGRASPTPPSKKGRDAQPYFAYLPRLFVALAPSLMGQVAPILCSHMLCFCQDWVPVPNQGAQSPPAELCRHP